MTVVQLPPYPASTGPAAALALEAARDNYLRAAKSIREELERAEAAVGDAFEAQDRRNATADRARAVARANRQRGRR